MVKPITFPGGAVFPTFELCLCVCVCSRRDATTEQGMMMMMMKKQQIQKGSWVNQASKVSLVLCSKGFSCFFLVGLQKMFHHPVGEMAGIVGGVTFNLC